MNIHPGLMVGPAPASTDPARWGHPTAAMSLSVILLSTAGLIGLWRRGRVVTGALLATSFITAIGTLALTTYSVSVPLLPGVTGWWGRVASARCWSAPHAPRSSRTCRQ